MKAYYFYIAFQLSILLVKADDGHQSVAKINQGETQLTFHKHSFDHCNKDSILIIYDRYDRSGAGIIFKVFYPTNDHMISIPDIPAGKYFVTIQCLGKHHDRFEKIVKIKSGKCQTISITLEHCDDYKKEAVVIPKDNINFSKLSIITMK